MIAVHCESRRDEWFENRLILHYLAKKFSEAMISLDENSLYCEITYNSL